MRIGVLNLSEVLKTEYTESLVAKLLAGISEKRQEQISHYFRSEDKLRSLAAEHLLMHMLREEKKLAESEYPLDFVKGQHGKPELADHPGVSFNLSHSGEIAVCALANGSAGQKYACPTTEKSDRHISVGIDVQEWRGVKDAVARRCFTDEEMTYLNSAEDKEKAFYQLWTLKESFMKVTGQGMSLPMKRVSFRIGEEIDISQDWDDKVYRARLYETGLHYELALCTEDKPAEKLEWYRLNPDGTIKSEAY